MVPPLRFCACVALALFRLRKLTPHKEPSCEPPNDQLFCPYKAYSHRSRSIKQEIAFSGGSSLRLSPSPSFSSLFIFAPKSHTPLHPRSTARQVQALFAFSSFLIAVFPPFLGGGRCCSASSAAIILYATWRPRPFFSHTAGRTHASSFRLGLAWLCCTILRKKERYIVSISAPEPLTRALTSLRRCSSAR